jgi:hypothetical protein
MKVEGSGDDMAYLLRAFGLLARRGAGEEAWASPFRDHPIAFLLDTVSDAASIWTVSGELLYQNRMARELGIGRGTDAAMEELSAGGRRFERRTIRSSSNGVEYVIEILREVPSAREGLRNGGG